MKINESVNSIKTLADYNEKLEAGKKAQDQVEKTKPETEAATLELGSKETEKATYQKPEKHRVDPTSVDAMIEESNRKMESFRNLIRTLITKQGGTVEGALKGDFIVEIDEATRQAAAEAISEDGEYGVKQTAERIVNFAKAISGGDVSKLNVLKDAIKKGFDEAEKILGELPDISKATYKEIMSQLDQWAGIGQVEK